MAIYRIFPEKDTFIYTDQVTGNAGRDEIVEIGGYPGTFDNGETSRVLTKYADSEINHVITNTIGLSNTGSMRVDLKMYLAEGENVPVGYTLKAYPLYTDGSTDWDNGTGKYGDIPVNTTGVSWNYIQGGLQTPWLTSGFPQFVTASFITGKEGGGTWYTASNGESMEFTQTHALYSNHDMEINVTPSIKQMYDNILVNNGFIVKIQDEYEFYTASSIRLQYFGNDTNTIYPPFLEFKWDDSNYNQGNLPLLDTDVCIINVNNNKGVYVDTGRQRFRLTARPQYPTRTFTTSSVYLTNYALPSASYWGIRDENTEEMIVDFDENYTKLSCDSKGSFFDVYMDGLQPERYYRILVKTTLDESTVVIDNQNIFKVVRNG